MTLNAASALPSAASTLETEVDIEVLRGAEAVLIEDEQTDNWLIKKVSPLNLLLP